MDGWTQCMKLLQAHNTKGKRIRRRLDEEVVVAVVVVGGGSLIFIAYSACFLEHLNLALLCAQVSRSVASRFCLAGRKVSEPDDVTSRTFHSKRRTDIVDQPPTTTSLFYFFSFGFFLCYQNHPSSIIPTVVVIH